MTRTIKAGEVAPGTLIEYSDGDITPRVPVHQVAILGNESVKVTTPKGRIVTLPITQAVTVLTEPVHVQPEEPTAFGARVVAGRERFLRCDCDSRPWRSVSEDGALGFFVDWPLVCEAGPVTVIDADPPWTTSEDAPEDTLVVPDRIEEWPKNDEHLRAYRWRDRDGDLWYSISDSRTPWVVGFADRTGAFHPYPKRGPFTRVTDA